MSENQVSVVFVTKDKGGFEASYPLAQELKRRGHQVKVFAEGVSLELWRASGLEPTFAGSLDFRREPNEVDAKVLLSVVNPDIVVATMGSPINLELECGKAANDLGIPLAIIEDVWGTSGRMTCPAQLAFTVDDFGVRLMRALPQFAAAKIIVAGNPGVSAFEVPSGIEERVERLREEKGTVVMFAGEGPGTSELLVMTFLSLRKSKERCVVVPRFHPKYLNVPENRVLWEGIVEAMAGDNVAVTRVFDDVSDTRALAALSDVTISGSSTVLQYAAKFGRMSVSITTELTRKLLGEQVAYNEYPGIKLGIAVPLREPCDIISLAREAAPGMRVNAKHVFRVLPIEEIADAVLSLA